MIWYIILMVFTYSLLSGGIIRILEIEDMKSKILYAFCWVLIIPYLIGWHIANIIMTKTRRDK